MVSVGVHELRNKLSRYLRMARDGEIVLITRRKRIVAVLKKPLCRRQDMREGKQHASKRIDKKIWPLEKGETQRLRRLQDHTWTIWHGKLVPLRGRPRRIKSLFEVVAEKLPFECIDDVKGDMKSWGLPTKGVYVGPMTRWDTLDM